MEQRASFPLGPERRESVAVGVGVAVLCVGLSTALIFPLRQVAPAISTGVVYLIAVLVVSIYRGLWLGIATAIASTISFNYFHVPPTGTLDVAKGEDWVALAVFLVVAVVVSSLAEQARSRVEDAERLQAAAVETEALRRADELKTALLRTVSHDLRSPLTAIIAGGEALAAERIEDADRRALAVAVSGEAVRLSRLVEKLLDLSRLESGQARPRPDWCSLEEVVGAAVEELGERGSGVAVDLDPSLPFVRADAAQLERVIFNLVENAVRVSRGGRAAISAVASDESVRLRVVDEGPGIPAEDLEAVFEPFYRGSVDARHDGSGLGLAIARGLVEVNQGRVWAEPAPDGGAALVVELPIRPVPEATERLAGESR